MGFCRQLVGVQFCAMILTCPEALAKACGRPSILKMRAYKPLDGSCIAELPAVAEAIATAVFSCDRPQAGDQARERREAVPNANIQPETGLCIAFRGFDRALPSHRLNRVFIPCRPRHSVRSNGSAKAARCERCSAAACRSKAIIHSGLMTKLLVCGVHHGGSDRPLVFVDAEMKRPFHR